MSNAAATALTTPQAWSNHTPAKFHDVGPPTVAQHIVFYRRDALPDDIARTLDATPPVARLSLAESSLDAGHGECGLTNTDVASDLTFAIRALHKPYDLLAWCIMPTHVHVLIALHPLTDLAEIVAHWMWSGGVSGPPKSPRDTIAWSAAFFSVAGSGDAWIAATKRHIDGDPVAAGLACDPESWHWSSASRSLSPARSRPPAGPREAAPPPPPRDPSRRATHVIFWLDDAVSGGFMRKLARLPAGRRPLLLNKALDKGRGRQSLIGRGAAATVQRELLAADSERYGLIAWCVMPTHVHVLLEEVEAWPVAELVAEWRSRTIAAANTRRFVRLGASPWAKAYSKTEIMGDDDIEDAKSYIEHNPVITGLKSNPGAWTWSSANDPRAMVGAS
jgi:REP element-mobilizing transposase RayT